MSGPRPLLSIAVAASLFAGAARAEPFRDTEMFDTEQVARVATAALVFMAPRILEPVPPGQLSVWGLRGLTTLDPSLTTRWEAGRLRLVIARADGERLVAEQPSPAETDAAGWGRLGAAMLRAGWDASRLVRASGAQEVVRTFFDELFNHLDPYSRYVPATEAVEERTRRVGEGGAGLTLARRGGRLVVNGLDADGPADLAGVRVGETLRAIDGEAVDPSDIEGAAALLAGDEGTQVTLELRSRSGAVHTVALERAVIVPDTVRASRAGPLLIVRVASFAGNTAARLRRALATGLAGARSIVLDLRGNRGGVLAQAVAAAQALLPAGIIATTAGRDPAARHAFRADASDVARDIPVVVLVDGRTASAAEVLAAALADQGRAVVIGSASTGKGLVQTIDPLPDGGSLFVTWSRVLAPLGWPIQGLGVLPQVCTSMGHDAALRQLRALVEGEQTLADALRRHRAARPPVPPAEALEIREACPAAEGGDTDLVAARFLADHPAAYAAALLTPPGTLPDAP